MSGELLSPEFVAYCQRCGPLGEATSSLLAWGLVVKHRRYTAFTVPVKGKEGFPENDLFAMHSAWVRPIETESTEGIDTANTT